MYTSLLMRFSISTSQGRRLEKMATITDGDMDIEKSHQTLAEQEYQQPQKESDSLDTEHAPPEYTTWKTWIVIFVSGSKVYPTAVV